MAYEKEALTSVKFIHAYCLDKVGDRQDQIHFEANVVQDQPVNLSLDVALNYQIQTETTFKLYSDDSINLLERPFYTVDEAK